MSPKSTQPDDPSRRDPGVDEVKESPDEPISRADDDDSAFDDDDEFDDDPDADEDDDATDEQQTQ